jgi:hypothetical protein
MGTVAETAIDIRPFQVEIPEGELAELRGRINATRWPSKERSLRRRGDSYWFWEMRSSEASS